MNSEIIQAIREKGILLEKGLFDVLISLQDPVLVGQLLDNFTAVSGQKFITKAILVKNLDSVRKVVDESSGNVKSQLVNILVKMGIQVEVKPIEIEKNIGLILLLKEI